MKAYLSTTGFPLRYHDWAQGSTLGILLHCRFIFSPSSSAFRVVGLTKNFGRTVTRLKKNTFRKLIILNQFSTFYKLVCIYTGQIKCFIKASSTAFKRFYREWQLIMKFFVFSFSKQKKLIPRRSDDLITDGEPIKLSFELQPVYCFNCMKQSRKTWQMGKKYMKTLWYVNRTKDFSKLGYVS